MNTLTQTDVFYFEKQFELYNKNRKITYVDFEEIMYAYEKFEEASNILSVCLEKVIMNNFDKSKEKITLSAFLTSGRGFFSFRVWRR